MLTDAQAAAIQAIIDAKAKSKPTPEVKLKPQTSSSVFGASSGVPSSSGGKAEMKARSDAAVQTAIKDATPAEILAAWTSAQTSDGGDPNQAFIEYFRNCRQ